MGNNAYQQGRQPQQQGQDWRSMLQQYIGQYQQPQQGMLGQQGLPPNMQQNQNGVGTNPAFRQLLGNVANPKAASGGVFGTHPAVLQQQQDALAGQWTQSQQSRGGGGWGSSETVWRNSKTGETTKTKPY